jgi:hypothetical protein
VAELERNAPLPAFSPERLVVEVDGALVPLVDGEWAEVKTLVIGTLGEPVVIKGETRATVQELSSFSRLCDNKQFERLALVETQRRGVERAASLAVVADGAAWIQGWIDYHCPEAVRILDFAHAAQYLTQLGASVHGEHTPALQAWLAEPCQRLKQEGGPALLPALQAWSERQPHAAARREALAYLDKRQAHMAYPDFRAAGWPIGSGAVESANKLVVEARLKGSGMHWARAHVNPMLALRNIVCSDRWDEAWAQIAHERRRQAWQCRKRHARPSAALSSVPVPTPPSPQPATLPPVESEPVTTMSTTRTNRPAPDHPWRKFRYGRALRQLKDAATPKS